MRNEHDLITGVILMKPYLSDIIVAGRNGFMDNANGKNLDYRRSLYDQQWLQQVLKKGSSFVRFISLHEENYIGLNNIIQCTMNVTM